MTSELASHAGLADGASARGAVPALSPPDAAPAVLVNEAGDDRDSIQPGDRVLLIVENDLGFSRFLLDTAREKGFKGLVTSLGAAALALTREYKPTADHARHLPAGHRGLARARAAEERHRRRATSRSA